MHAADRAYTLLADSHLLEEMCRYFREGRNVGSLQQTVFAAGLLLAILAAGYIISRLAKRREQQSFDDPQALFRELCRAHQLNFRSRRMLRRLARLHRMEQPGLIFLEPERFDMNAVKLPASFSKEKLESLRDQIFGRKLAKRGTL